MAEDKDRSEQARQLRKRAEELRSTRKPTDVKKITSDQIKELINELEVHQIELEMQNDELRRAQAVIEESRAKYSDLYDFAPVGYLTMEKSGLIVEANLTSASLLGLERPVLVGSLFTRFMGPHFLEAFNAYQNKVFSTPGKQSCELTLKRKDGTSFYGLLESVAVAYVEGNVPKCYCSITDISNLKATQAALSSAVQNWTTTFNAIGEATCLMDSNGKITRANAAFEAFVGKPFFEFENQCCSEAIHRSRAPIANCPFERAKKTRLRESLETQLGDGRWVIITVDPIFGGDGNLAGAVYVIQDVTARKLAEVALREKVEMLEEYKRVTVGREIKMIELKKDINRLSKELGRPEPWV